MGYLLALTWLIHPSDAPMVKRRCSQRRCGPRLLSRSARNGRRKRSARGRPPWLRGAWRQRMISGLLLPSCVRLELRTPWCADLGASGPRADHVQRTVGFPVAAAALRRCLTTLPEEPLMGETPHGLAKEASLPDLLGSSLRPRSTAWRRCRYRCPPKRPTQGRLAPPADRGERLALRDLLRVGLVTAGHPTEREPGGRESTSSGSSARRKRAATRTSSFVQWPRKRSRSSSGAVRRKPSSWSAARLLVLSADRRADRETPITSAPVCALLGSPTASPATTAPAAASASMGSDSPLGPRWRRLGLSSSTTEIPVALRWRASPAP
jgi:hypothetical protein